VCRCTACGGRAGVDQPCASSGRAGARPLRWGGDQVFVFCATLAPLDWTTFGQVPCVLFFAYSSGEPAAVPVPHRCWYITAVQSYRSFGPRARPSILSPSSWLEKSSSFSFHLPPADGGDLIRCCVERRGPYPTGPMPMKTFGNKAPFAGKVRSVERIVGRGSHLSTSQLNLRRFCHSRRQAYHSTQQTRVATTGDSRSAYVELERGRVSDPDRGPQRDWRDVPHHHRTWRQDALLGGAVVRHHPARIQG